MVDRAERPLAGFPLKFEFGPVTLWAPRFSVIAEDCEVRPGIGVAPPPPQAGLLPKHAAGLLRRSEPCGQTRPLVSWQNGLVRYVISSFERRFIDLTGDFDAYLGKFSSKTRSTLKRKLRKFTEASQGRIEWRQYRTAAELMEFHREARGISQRSYQEKLFNAGLPADEAFLAGMRAQGEMGRARAYLLFLEGRAISYLYCWASGGRLQYGYLGFMPECAGLSPGTVLQYLALEALFAERAFPLFDFTEGDGDHKRLFATDSVPCATVLYLRPSPTTLLMLGGHRLVAWLSALASRVSERLGLKARLRQLLRGQRSKPIGAAP
jgi:CelD/BcsL family acetyltransferase involved in cellulose biosynthesis